MSIRTQMPVLNPKNAPYVLLSPFLLLFVLFRMGPILWSAGMSLMEWNGFQPPQFVGVANYVHLFKSERFYKGLFNTLYFVLVYNILMLTIALLLAVQLTAQGTKGKKFFRTINFIPIATSLTVCALIFDRLLASNYGFVNLVLRALGGSGETPFISSAEWIKPSIVVMRLWRGTGYYSAFLIAGLLSIPRDQYEAGDLDGCTPFQKFFHITIPNLRPVLLFCVTMSVILTFQIFDEPWILTQGGPSDSSLTLQILLYQNSFAFNKLGVGSAISYVMTLLMVGFSILNSTIMERK